MPSRRTSSKRSPVDTKRNRKNPPRKIRNAGAAGAAAAELAGEDLEEAPTLHKSVHVAGITYQHELVRCGKPRCGRCKRGAAHGPYWYAYWRSGTSVKKKYVGKKLRFTPPPSVPA